MFSIVGYSEVTVQCVTSFESDVYDERLTVVKGHAVRLVKLSTLPLKRTLKGRDGSPLPSGGWRESSHAFKCLWVSVAVGH